MVLRREPLRGWVGRLVTPPVLFLGIVILSYGLWIPWLGLFGDDLAYLYYYHLLGPWGPGAFASIDRPASALFYAISMSILGEAVWPYHVFMVVLRWLSAVLLWWVLRLVWPERGREAVVAGLLLAVYPGFRQNPVALEFILHFAVFDLFLFSLGMTLLSARRTGRYVLYAAASGISALSVFWLEYFIGLEILRPLFLWFVTRREGLKGREQWKRIAAAWAPALAAVLAFVFWRVFIFNFRTYQPVLLEELSAGIGNGLAWLASKVFTGLWVSLVLAWQQAMNIPDRALLVRYGLLAAAAFAAVLAYLGAAQRAPEPASQRQGRYSAEVLLAIGLLAALAGGAPFWLTGIPIELPFPWDRSTLSFMLGSSLVTVALIEMIVTPRYRALAAAGLVALAVGLHFVNAVEYRAEWQKLRSFYWQMTWRAPQLEPGTLVLFDVIPLNRYSDNDMTAMLNWIYAPELEGPTIPLKFFDLTIRLDSEHAGLPGIEKGLPVVHNHRGLFYETTTTSTLALHYNPPGCLKILRPEDTLMPGLPERLVRVLPITRVEQIVTNSQLPARPPAQMGEEPAHDWCYYYQKADLARQTGDWQMVAYLGSQAFAAGMQPADPGEMLLFVEGFAKAGDLAQARALTTQQTEDESMQPALCQLWKEIGTRPLENASAVEGMLSELGCQS